MHKGENENESDRGLEMAMESWGKKIECERRETDEERERETDEERKKEERGEETESREKRSEEFPKKCSVCGCIQSTKMLSPLPPRPGRHLDARLTISWFAQHHGPGQRSSAGPVCSLLTLRAQARDFLTYTCV